MTLPRCFLQQPLCAAAGKFSQSHPESSQQTLAAARLAAEAAAAFDA